MYADRLNSHYLTTYTCWSLQPYTLQLLITSNAKCQRVRVLALWLVILFLSLNRHLESVQRKFTKRLKGCKDMEYYHARLSHLYLHGLERRHLTADLILTYRIIFGLVDVCMSGYFVLKSVYSDRVVTRSNPFKLSVNYCRSNTRKYFCSELVVKVWNSLPPSIVNFSSLATFRNSLTKINFRIYTTY